MYYLRNKNLSIFQNAFIVLLFSSIIYTFFFGLHLERANSQGFILDGIGGSDVGASDADSRETSSGIRRNPFKSWFPDLPPVIEVINDTIVEIRDNVFRPRLNLSRFNLQGIIWSISDSRAIINGEIYKIGDEINSAKIIKMDKKGVTLQYYEEEHTLSIPELIKMEVPNDEHRDKRKYEQDIYYQEDDYNMEGKFESYGVP